MSSAADAVQQMLILTLLASGLSKMKVLALRNIIPAGVPLAYILS